VEDNPRMFAKTRECYAFGMVGEPIQHMVKSRREYLFS
jgi:hypothetical protein